MNTLRETILLIFVAIVPATLAVMFHPELADRARAGLEAGAVRLEEIRAWDAPVLWIDARDVASFARGSIPGAVHLAPGRFQSDLGSVLAAWQPGMRIVVFCSSLSCATSREIAQRLRDAGLQDVHHLHRGWEAWEEARQP
ncbi:MAG: rhodanese-like domain-containing protein [Opitutaceae bacterium]